MVEEKAEWACGLCEAAHPVTVYRQELPLITAGEVQRKVHRNLLGSCQEVARSVLDIWVTRSRGASQSA